MSHPRRSPGGRLFFLLSCYTGLTTKKKAAQAAEREIREELDAEIKAGDVICTVEYDYPKFHLYMYCIRCELISAGIRLLEHESAKWLGRDELDSVKWLPSDTAVIEELRKLI